MQVRARKKRVTRRSCFCFDCSGFGSEVELYVLQQQS